MKKCSACGFQLPDVAKYCYSCGSRLSKDVNRCDNRGNEKAQSQRKKGDSSKACNRKTTSCAATSAKKRWKFVVLGILFGFFGVHLAYAKRWLLFLLLWSGFICGNVMNEKTADKTQDTATEVREHSQEALTEGNANDTEKESSNPIGNAGIAVWALLWIGGTLFIKKDGNGYRM